MNLNLNVPSQRFTITTNAPLSTAKTTAATVIGNSKLVKSGAGELRYVPVVMNNNIVTAAVGGMPAHNHHTHASLQQQHQHHYPTAAIAGALPTTVATAGGSLLHILPLPLTNGAAGASVLTANNGSATTLLPHVALIGSGGTAGATADTLSVQTTTPPLGVLTTSSSSSSSNTITSVAPHEGHPNTTTVTVATPINVLLAAAAAGGTGGNVTTANAGVATSILIRNQPQFSNTTLPRGATVLPLLNQELVKQIVVGTAPQKPLTGTLLKSQQTPKQLAPAQIQKPPQPPKRPLQPITKLATNNKPQQSALQKSKVGIQIASATSGYSNTLLPTKPNVNAMQQEQIPISTAPMALVAHKASVAHTAAAADNNSMVDKLSTPEPAAPANIQQPSSVVVPKESHVSAAESAQKVGKTAEKQESLLKVRSVPRIIVGCTSPRSKRSKSLNCALKQEQPGISHSVAAERRHSSASENKSNAISPVSAQEEVINLLDSSSEYLETLEELSQNESDQTTDAADETAEEKVSATALEHTEIDEGVALAVEDAKIVQEPAAIEIDDSATDTDVVVSSMKDVVESPVPQLQVDGALDDDGDRSTDDATEVLFKDIKLKEQLPATPTDNSLEQSPSLEKSLYCDEKISISSSSSASTTSSHHSLQDEVVVAPIAIKPTASSPTAALDVSSAAPTNPFDNSYSCVLKMLAAFNMLTWDNLVGTARDTKLQFQLNEFNLLEVHESGPARSRIHTAYEKPIYEREVLPRVSIQKERPLYLCRRCNCHGPAADFLGPEFCSLECLKRDIRKRQRESVGVTMPSKRGRKEPLTAAAPQPVTTNAKKQFRWSTYLPGKYDAIAAPVCLFLNPFPTGPNSFQIGMKLEAIDPENCALFCVCTVVDIQGYRLKLTFDGYEYMYDFWVNADSMDIFPPGWCAKTNRVLQPPKGKTVAEFNWPSYLAECKALPAQRQLFTHLNASYLSSRNPFKVGMHLEAEDLNDTGKLCVASVADVLDDRIRVHFDGWDDCYDYWVDINSPYIHPCGWHIGRQQLIVPPEFENATFNWSDYINYRGNGVAALEELFAARDAIDFKSNMKLEVVDPRNSSLIRPATVVGRKGHRVKLHLDCWPHDYCFWLEDDSPDLHPIGWCEATGHELEPPPGYKMRPAKLICPTVGCRGIGNAKRLYLNTHATRECCPYTPENWRQKLDKPPRLEHDEIVRSVSVKQQQPSAPKHPMDDKQILERIQLLDNIKTRHVLQQEKRPSDSHGDYNGAYEQLLVIKRELNCDTEAEPQMAVETTSGDDTDSLATSLKIAKEFLCDYGPRLQQNYHIWQQNATFDVKKIKRNPLLWTTKETSAFVERTLHSATAAAAFAREDIDGSALLQLQQSDLTDVLELKLGPAVKLYSCILQLRTLVVLKFDLQTSD